MKMLFVIGSVLILLFCTAYLLLVNPIYHPTLKPSPAKIADFQAELKGHVAFMSEQPRARMHLNIDVLDTVAAYIHKHFSRYCEEVSYQTYEVDGKTYRNVIGVFNPKAEETLVVGAHYDVCDHLPGADDNASGVAGLLEIVRLWKEQNCESKYRIEFVAYTLEEPPYFRTEQMGSAVHAESLLQAKRKVRAMVCLEMIGYFSDRPKSQDFPIGALKAFYPTVGNYIVVVGKLTNGGLVRHMKEGIAKGSEIEVHSINSPKGVPGIDFSDHRNYWARKMDAVMITNTAFYRNKNYHKATDVKDSLDYKRMQEVVKGTWYALKELK